jgi:hypothetical protein
MDVAPARVFAPRPLERRLSQIRVWGHPRDDGAAEPPVTAAWNATPSEKAITRDAFEMHVHEGRLLSPKKANDYLHKTSQRQPDDS